MQTLFILGLFTETTLALDLLRVFLAFISVNSPITRMIVIVSGLGVIISYSVFRMPVLGLGLLPISSLLLPRVSLIGDLAINMNLFIIPVICVSILWSRRKVTLPKKHTIALFGLAAIGPIGLGRLAAQKTPVEAVIHLAYFAQWILYLGLPLIIWVLLSDLSRENRERARRYLVRLIGIASALIVVHLITVTLGILPAIAGGQRIEMAVGKQRLRTIWASGPNQVGMFLTVLALLSTAMAFEQEKRNHMILFVLASIVCVWLLVQTYSRSALLGLIFGFLLIVSVNHRRAVAHFSVLFGIGYLLVPQSIRIRFTRGLLEERYIEPIGRTLPVGQLHQRLTLWLGQLQEYRVNPLFGSGFFPLVSDNTYLNLFFGIGLAGLLLTLYFFTLLLRDGIVAYRISQQRMSPLDRGLTLGTLASFGGFLVWAVFGDIYAQFRVLGLVFLLLGLSLSCLPLGNTANQEYNNS